MIKKAIVGTGVGVWMQSQRSRFAVVSAGLAGNPEQAAMLANDVIGETIVERFCQPGESFLDGLSIRNYRTEQRPNGRYWTNCPKRLTRGGSRLIVQPTNHHHFVPQDLRDRHGRCPGSPPG